MIRKKAVASRIEEGTFIKCSHCGEILLSKSYEENLWVCRKCGRYKRLTAAEKITLLSDEKSFKEMFRELASNDPLRFTDTAPYADRLKKYRQKTGLLDAVVTGTALMNGAPFAIGAMDFEFMGGSMGYVVGEKLTLIGEHAIKKKIPLVIVSSSGGARMQEGILSLMQMAKVSAMIGRMNDKGLPYISIINDPTTGGVTASFAMLGDVIISEPGALIGFAGPRVIEQTIRQTLPEGFQRAEFLLKHGMIDMIVPREAMKSTVTGILSILTGK